MKFPTTIPFADKLGLRLLRFENGEAQIGCELTPELCNSWHVAHGGLVMTMLDVAMAHAAKSGRVVAASAAIPGAITANALKANGVVTVEMKTSFMRPGTGALVADAKVLTQTASLSFCEGRVLDASGALVAHATGTFKMLRALPLDGRKVARPDASD